MWDVSGSGRMSNVIDIFVPNDDDLPADGREVAISIDGIRSGGTDALPRSVYRSHGYW